jgi:di/tricarboxylate transporter
MVGSSPLILLNDLLPNDMEPFDLFDVTPIGAALLATGILYFVLFGRLVLPAIYTKGAKAEDTMAYFARVYGLTYQLREMRVPHGSSLVGQVIGELERAHRVRIIASRNAGDLRVSPHRDTVMEAGMDIAVMGENAALSAFAVAGGLEAQPMLNAFADALAHTKAGVSEVVLPPNSSLIGKTVRELWLRKTYGLSVLAIHRGGETISEDVRDLPLQAGDTLVIYSSWEALARLEQNPDFVVVTTEYPHEELRPQKVGFALLFFLTALGLILFTDLHLAISLLVGALGMIITGVLTMDEAYQAVSWKTVFLLASLIPLGAAVQDTGTAAWIAQETLRLLGDVEPWVMQAAIAVLATFFTLVMSNVGATVLLAPLAVGVALAAQAQGIDADPRVFALTVAIATSNSFIIPTHQVNALLMGPGGYQVKDFMRAGGIMTVLFLAVSLAMLNLVF